MSIIGALSLRIRRSLTIDTKQIWCRLSDNWRRSATDRNALLLGVGTSIRTKPTTSFDYIKHTIKLPCHAYLSILNNCQYSYNQIIGLSSIRSKQLLFDINNLIYSDPSNKSRCSFFVICWQSVNNIPHLLDEILALNYKSRAYLFVTKLTHKQKDGESLSKFASFHLKLFKMFCDFFDGLEYWPPLFLIIY